jgi:hypothetical protein
MAPFTIICWLTSRPIIISPLLMVPIISDPMTVPITVPVPPNKLVPPRITAAITDSSSPSPKVNRPDYIRPAYRRPANPANKPVLKKTSNFTL